MGYVSLTLDCCNKAGIYKVIKVDDADELRRQLASRGFVPGALLDVVRFKGSGPMLVEVRHARVAIGRAEAKKIIVQPVLES